MNTQRRKRRWWLWGVILLVLIGGGFSAWRAYRKASAPPETRALEAKTLTETINVSGVVQSERSVTLKARAAATVLQRRVLENERVTRGTPLLSLDTDVLRIQREQAQVNASTQSAQAQQELNAAQKNYEQLRQRRKGNLLNLQNQLQQAEENLFFIERDFERKAQLRQEEVISPQALDQQRQQLTQARLQLKNARSSLATAEQSDPELMAARSRIQQAQTALSTAQRQGRVNLSLAAENLNQAGVRAPFEGSISSWSVNQGDYLTPGSPVGIFQDLQDIRLNLAVNELDFPKIRLGAPVEIIFDAYPEQNFVGSVVWRSSASVSNNDNLQVFPVKVWFDNKDQLIKPGMSGDANIQVAQRHNVLAVPLSAIQKREGKLYVSVLRAGEVEDVEVQVGISTLDEVEIVKGLQTGDALVVERPTS